MCPKPYSDLDGLEANFLELFDIFIKKDALCVQEKRTDIPGKIIDDLMALKDKPKKAAKAPALLETLKRYVEAGAKRLPGHYRHGYSEPLLKNLDAVYEWSPGTLETLTAAVYDHLNDEYSDRIKELLAFTSNIYRSYLHPEALPLAGFPQPVSTLPALVTFNPRPDIPSPNSNSFHFVPFTLPVGEVERLCGGKVAVVSLPSCYRDHPVLSWECVAHESGGHDILHAYPGLLPELKQGVRELFYRGPDPLRGVPESMNQYLGLLWQWWTEEAASDVYAVMNLGPAYGVGLAMYFGALNEAIRGPFKGVGRDKCPALTVSNSFIPFTRETIDYHPPNTLALYVVIGAIDALPLPEQLKNTAVQMIQAVIKVCLSKGNMHVLSRYRKGTVDNYMTDKVRIQKWLQLKPGSWIEIDPNHFSVDLDTMHQHARRVGYYIATARLRTFNGYSIQDLETWDEADESDARDVSQIIANKMTPRELSRLNFMAEDAQLFSGALRALFTYPKKYDDINKNLSAAFRYSFTDDEVWGNPPWHKITDPVV